MLSVTLAFGITGLASWRGGYLGGYNSLRERAGGDPTAGDTHKLPAARGNASECADIGVS